MQNKQPEKDPFITGGSQTPRPTNDDALNSAGIDSAPFCKIACTSSMFVKENLLKFNSAGINYYAK